ncbi:hypothetical protein, partial [Congregibacter sp.]|uniref:hypothetical protein n=1 Tax=Congregibacter sp. TaxID=2744308 RepID=UPI003F6CCE56
MLDGIASYVLVALLGGFIAHKSFVRLRLSRAKHPSLRGHAKWSRRLARLVPYYSFSEDEFFRADGAPANVEGHRRQAMQGLRQTLRATQPKSLEHSKSLDRSVSDVSFTAAY